MSSVSRTSMRASYECMRPCCCCAANVRLYGTHDRFTRVILMRHCCTPTSHCCSVSRAATNSNGAPAVRGAGLLWQRLNLAGVHVCCRMGTCDWPLPCRAGCSHWRRTQLLSADRCGVEMRRWQHPSVARVQQPILLCAALLASRRKRTSWWVVQRPTGSCGELAAGSVMHQSAAPQGCSVYRSKYSSSASKMTLTTTTGKMYPLYHIISSYMRRHRPGSEGSAAGSWLSISSDNNALCWSAISLSR